MARITWFVSACISIVLGALTTAYAVRDFAVNLADGWPAYHPSPGESIALDVAAREIVDHRQPGIASRFANFLIRALRHDQFTADHYDPGWRPA